MDRDALLLAIQERNVAYKTCRSVTEENQALTHEVDYLREQLHRLEAENASLVRVPGNSAIWIRVMSYALPSPTPAGAAGPAPPPPTLSC